MLSQNKSIRIRRGFASYPVNILRLSVIPSFLIWRRHQQTCGSVWVARKGSRSYLRSPAYLRGGPLSAATLFTSLWKRKYWLCLHWHQIDFGSNSEEMPLEAPAAVSTPAKRCCRSSLTLYACCSWLGGRAINLSTLAAAIRQLCRISTEKEGSAEYNGSANNLYMSASLLIVTSYFCASPPCLTVSILLYIIRSAPHPSKLRSPWGAACSRPVQWSA